VNRPSRVAAAGSPASVRRSGDTGALTGPIRKRPGHDIERDGERARQRRHVHPAARSGGAHAEAGEQRSAETEPEQQHVDDLRRMLLGRADPQPGDLERGTAGASAW